MEITKPYTQWWCMLLQPFLQTKIFVNVRININAKEEKRETKVKTQVHRCFNITTLIQRSSNASIEASNDDDDVLLDRKRGHTKTDCYYNVVGLLLLAKFHFLLSLFLSFHLSSFFSERQNIEEFGHTILMHLLDVVRVVNYFNYCIEKKR